MWSPATQSSRTQVHTRHATRYTEAFPQKTIDAPHVAEELMKFFSRVGVPKEILTDQDTNFMSKLLTELYRMLHVQPIRTSPHHPQTDGLVERFNRTLKTMLNKLVGDEGKNWDQLLPYLLFAYREVPQASTGFSPFELVYGRQVRGPLDIIKESWEADKCSSLPCTYCSRQTIQDVRISMRKFTESTNCAKEMV